MTTIPQPETTNEQVTQNVQPQEVTEQSGPTRKTISEALEQTYQNLEITMNKWDTLGGSWRVGLFDELARSCRELEEVAELIKGRMDPAKSS
jgi:hypothetical protein